MHLPARAYYNQRHVVNEDSGTLRALAQAVAWPTDLSLAQWCSWYSVALEFQPDLIIELGRGMGNSTTLFTLAAHRMPGTKVFSFCLSDQWDRLTRPRLLPLTGEAWFAPLSTYLIDICEVDFTHLILPAKRILLLWDAHGYVVADRVLSHIMPLLAQKEHVVICHDVSDNRLYPDAPRQYGGKTIWRGMDSYYADSDRTSRTNLFWLNTVVDQFVPILDFCWRNRIDLRSADWEMKGDMADNPLALAEIERETPSDCFSVMNHWAYFSLNESPGPLTFPTSAMRCG
ncbi:hypothetical protein MTBLM1_80186 [Rhodospirillaceae bacterium LM-1]|nr:hypothetical protein MTBLM1_80186 [Rhodospirillaceae bacterium LM-1]